jgi:hypothetical protein
MISMQANLEYEKQIPPEHHCLYLRDVHGNIMFELGTPYPVFRFSPPARVDIYCKDSLDAWATEVLASNI